MRFVTVASSDQKPELKYLLHSCSHFGIQMDLAGLGRPYLGNGTKIVYLIQYLQQLPKDEVVLFTDAYDSFFVRPVDTLKSDFERKNSPLIMTAEDNFYFRLTSVKRAIQNPLVKWKYPASKSVFPNYRYLNSGGFIGYAGHILDLFKYLQIDKTMYSDQPKLHLHFINHPEDISLDYDHEFFTIYGKHASEETFEVRNDELTNKNTGSKPYVFHFPGKVHRGLDNFASQFSFIKR
ncbi:MAG: hypothetical protein RJQ14_04610 [Marinoscillum sp.]